MKRSISYIIISIIIFAAFGGCTACGNTTDNERITYSVVFNAEQGGRIEGNTHQTINAGESTQKVIAIADIGYYFAGWSDGEKNSDETVTRAERIVENVREDSCFYAMFARITLQVEYAADAYGEIEGELIQSGKYGDDTLAVTAVPNRGYRFVGWSDGVKEPTRHDIFIENKTITAIFEAITNVYKYNYKFADSNCEEETISLTYGQLEDTVFAVPNRAHATFGGWYADKFLTQQVSDSNGNIVVGDELFYNVGTQLYAKWISENRHKYKILIVYVTELNAELTTRDGNGKIKVDYKMTDTERQICQMVTEKISFELNDLALADFQIDEYFTTIPLKEENIQETHPINSKVDHKVYAYDIPEVQGLLEEYDSILVSYSMDDYFGNLHNSVGEANSKYGSINFDGGLAQLVLCNEPIENLLNPYHYYWDGMLDPYLHEFAHTIELCVNNIFEYHEVLSEYLQHTDELISQKLYFLNKAIVNGKTVGVPYEYWEGKVAEVYYEVTEGGKVRRENYMYIYIYGHTGDTQYVLYGDDALAVTAEPMKGYEFVEWSDGVKTATRHDVNITDDLHIYALFRPVGA